MSNGVYQHANRKHSRVKEGKRSIKLVEKAEGSQKRNAGNERVEIAKEKQ